ncbi:hypothetical protein OF83DRAFT_1168813 [Amylostereum chailletii]|nr:hypothetical protein OF83DRAFT_1168813 [Amylostereum chailletii]
MTLAISVENSIHRFNSLSQDATRHIGEHIVNAQLLHSSQHHYIYRGELTSTRNPSGTPVVVKFARTELALRELVRENVVYTTTLESLQGVWIPRYYGQYENHDATSVLRDCIILEWCGSPVEVEFSDLNEGFKTCIIQAVTAIHKLGIVHNKLVEDNVLDYHGRPMIIDFAVSDDEKCGKKMAICEGNLQPPFEDFNCEEIFLLCHDLQIWKPGHIRLNLQDHPARWVADPRRLACFGPKAPGCLPPMRRALIATKLHLQQSYPEVWEKIQSELRTCFASSPTG